MAAFRAWTLAALPLRIRAPLLFPFDESKIQWSWGEWSWTCHPHLPCVGIRFAVPYGLLTSCKLDSTFSVWRTLFRTKTNAAVFRVTTELAPTAFRMPTSRRPSHPVFPFPYLMTPPGISFFCALFMFSCFYYFNPSIFYLLFFSL